jgi:hypothetical protein
MSDEHPYDTAEPRKPKGEMTQAELIREEIERLHRRGSGDWQSLDRQVLKEYKTVKFNLLQAAMNLMITQHDELYVEAGAGAGKSTGIGDFMRRLVMGMPRSSTMLVGETYQQILTRTLPTTIHGLEQLGIFKGLHYFVGQKAPRNWKFPEPYKPPLDWKKSMHFWTGACVNFFSQDVQGDGKSANSDAFIADEATQLDKPTLDTDQLPRVRGSNHDLFKDKSKFPLYLKKLFVSTTAVTDVGMWYEQLEEKIVADHERITEILKKQVLSPKRRENLLRELNMQRFLKATWKVNRMNLPENYILDAKKRSLDDMLFQAEYNCVRPQRVKGGFYSLLDVTRHCYTAFDYGFYDALGKVPDCRGDKDLTAGQPLILGVDWGARINCLTTNQHLKSINEYRTLKDMYVLGDEQKIQDDLFIEFDRYYSPHKASNNELLMYYDNQGNVQTGISKQTRAEKAKAQLTALGWKVRLMTFGGRNDDQDLTYRTWLYLLRDGHPGLPKYTMNKANCPALFTSMRHAKAKEGKDGMIHKDKTSEGSTVIARQHATDLSDANDKPIRAMFGHVINRQGLLGSSVGTRFG